MPPKKFVFFSKKFDNFKQMRYNKFMEQTIVIIGGGASGLMLADALPKTTRVIIVERGERLGRKLSATGNGQGNVTNINAHKEAYFSVEDTRSSRAESLVREQDPTSLQTYFSSLGVLLAADGRGRVYPTGKQASALTDALRYSIARKGVETRLQARAIDLEKTSDGFFVTVQTESGTERIFAEYVAVCAGGKAAKNFGTDGSAYALVKPLGHTVTALYPSLVQLKTDTKYTKTLKGIRVADGVLTAKQKGQTRAEKGDILFTEYGISGDATFRISAFIADKITDGVELTVDFLPDFSEEQLLRIVTEKQKTFPDLPSGELLFGIVNNQIGRAIMKRADGDVASAVRFLKAFPLTVTGTLGFDYAQVTKGGIPLSETDGDLQSRFAKNLYFAGEILDVDGQCGGFNLQWAYSSAKTVAAAIIKKCK